MNAPNEVEAQTISLVGATIGELGLQRARVKTNARGGSLYLDQATVHKRIMLSGVNLDGTLMLRGASVGGNIETATGTENNATGSEPKQSQTRIGALDLSDCRIAGTIRIEAALTKGGIFAPRAEVHGTFDLAKFTSIKAFSAGKAVNEGDVLVAEGVTIRRLLVSRTLRAAGALDLSEAVVGTLEVGGAAPKSGGSRQASIPKLDGDSQHRGD